VPSACARRKRPAHSGTPAAIVFGAPVSLSGSQAKEGRLTQEGYDFWARYVNEHGGLRVGNFSYRVEIRYRDDTSKPTMTALGAQSLITDGHVDFLLGPYGSAQTFAAATVAEEHRVPLIASGGSAERTFNQGAPPRVDRKKCDGKDLRLFRRARYAGVSRNAGRHNAQAVLGSAQWSPAVTYYGRAGFYRTS
jgi:hypothetical protein